MAHYYEDDICMDDGLDGEETCATNEGDRDLVERDRQAHENHKLKLFMVKDKVMHKPSLDTLYYNQPAALMPNIPDDLQLPLLLSEYNTIASYNFVAQKTGQDPRLTRIIWLYGIDQYHSLASYHENTRFNILAMAYAWAANYPAELCDEAAVTMAQSYIDGWMSFMGNQHGPKSFACQEAFIKLWRSSEYDLMRFTEGERTRIQKSIILMRDRSFPPKLLETVEDKIGDIIRMRREGNISDEIWQAYGTKLVMAWVFSKIDADKSEKAEMDDDMIRLEATQTADAKAMAASVNGNALSQVPWYSPLLKGLLEPMDPAAREPWKLMKDKTISRPHGKPWTSVDVGGRRWTYSSSS